MIDKIKVNLSTDHIWECSTDIIGREGEGNTTRFEITVPEKLVGWSVYLDFTKPNGEKLRTPKLNIENGVVYYDVVPYLLTDDGELKAQAVIISASNQTWKSSNKTYHIQDSIDADEAIPDKEDFFTQITRAIERIETMLGSLNGKIVVGRVDENNIITISGDLPEGTYTAKYVMGDGSTVVIGDFEYDGSSSGGNGGGTVAYNVTRSLTNCTISNTDNYALEGGTYYAVVSANSGYTLSSVTVTMGGSPVSVSNGVINISKVTGDIVITVVATASSSNANSVASVYGLTENAYLGSTNGEISSNLQTGVYTTGFIPCTVDDTICFENMNFTENASRANYHRVCVYDTSKVFIGFFNANGVAQVRDLEKDANGTWKKFKLGATSHAGAGFIRVCCEGITDASVITIIKGTA